MSLVMVDRVGSVGYLTLNQPSTLNALTLDMVDALHSGLTRHEADPAVAVIVVRSNNEKAFCAGGDMKKMRQHQLDGELDAIATFFTREYALNLAISRCSKPYVSIIDGVAMGGGLGISVHGSHVVVTERALMAMPESRIGFFPDVGASYFLQRLPYDSGHWLALTAQSVRAQEAVLTGLASHFLPSESLPSLLQRLEQSPPHPDGYAQKDDSVNRVSAIMEPWLASAADERFEQTLADRQRWFADLDIARIRQQLTLAAADNDDAARLLTLLDGASPLSLDCTVSLFRRTQGLSLEACLAQELELTTQVCAHPDFVEGIRAVLVDKDRRPAWL